MRKISLLATFLLTVCAIVTLMAASAELFEQYEFERRLDQFGEPVAGRVIGGELPDKLKSGAAGTPSRGEHRVFIQLLEGPRTGDVVSQRVAPSRAGELIAGQRVRVLVGESGVQVLELRRDGGALGYLLAALLSVLGAGALVYRIKRLPVKADSEKEAG